MLALLVAGGFSFVIASCSAQGNTNENGRDGSGSQDPDDPSGDGSADGADSDAGTSTEATPPDVYEIPKNTTGSGSSPCVAAPTGHTWFVKAGATGAKGTLEEPFSSIQTAAEAAKPGDTVMIAGGVYRETVRPKASGTPQAPITYKGCDGPAIISGNNVITGPWSASSDLQGIHVAELGSRFTSKLNQAEQLFVDGRMMIEARHPNTLFNSLDLLRAEFLSVDRVVDKGRIAHPGELKWHRFEIEDAEISEPAGTWDGATIWLKPRNGGGGGISGNAELPGGGGWGFSRQGVVKSQTPGKLIVEASTSVEHIEEPWGEPYHLGQTLAALDAPGEWLHKDGQLYLKMPNGGDPKDHLIEIKRRDYAFDLSDRKNIVVEDITVFGATITTDHESGNHGNSLETWRGRRDVASAENIVIKSIRAMYVNHFTNTEGWELGQWVQTSGLVISGRRHQLRDSIIEYSAGNGVLVIGENHQIQNNIVHDVNYQGVFAAGIAMGMESPNKDFDVGHNTVWATGFDGIMAQRLFSTNRDSPARVHHNRVMVWGLLNRDVGGIKSVGDWDANGTRWDHNVVSGGSAWAHGLYWDFTQDHLADHNVVYETVSAMNMNEGIDHRVYNNSLFGTGDSFSSVGPRRNVDIRNNLLSHGDVDKPNQGGTFSDNLSFASEALFKNPRKGDYRLLNTAGEAINSGVEIPPFTDGWQGASPDLGAFELGADWTAGSDLPHPIPRPEELSAVAKQDGVELSWSDRAPNERHYYVERAEEIGGSSWRIWEVIAELGPDTEQYFDSKPIPRLRKRFYRIRADRSMYSDTLVIEN